jgi:hypothetical protein
MWNLHESSEKITRKFKTLKSLLQFQWKPEQVVERQLMRDQCMNILRRGVPAAKAANKKTVAGTTLSRHEASAH